MRKLMMIALLAGAAVTPALAQSDPDQHGRVERGDSRAEIRPAHRPQRSERSEGSRGNSFIRQALGQSDAGPVDNPPVPIERSQSDIEPAPVRSDRSQPDGARGERRFERVERAPSPGYEAEQVLPSESGGDRRIRRAGDAVRAWRGESGDSVRDWRRAERRNDGPQIVDQSHFDTGSRPQVRDGRSIEERNLRQVRRGDALERPVRTTPGFGERRVGRIGNTVPVEGSAPPPVDRATAMRGRTDRSWQSSWRHDRRYDWRKHRDRNRFIFRPGFYHDPFGWRYRRYHIGWRLWPSYYQSYYWLHDPWMYRLPPVYGPYRWIRYHDDALLVNIYTGQVVDVIYDFFW